MNLRYTLELAPKIVPSKHLENNQNCSRRVLHSNRIFNFLRGTRRMKNRLAREQIASAYRSRRDETKRKEGFKARILTRSGGLTRAAVRQRGSARVARPPSFFNRQSEAGARSRGSRSRMHLNWTNERGIPARVRGGEGGFGGRRGRGEAVATPLRACVHKRFHGAEAGALRAAPLPGQRRDGPVRP